MANSRYISKSLSRSGNDSHQKLKENRADGSIVHYETIKVADLTSKQIRSLTLLSHVWTIGDKYYKLAHRHYGDASLWWLIAWYNAKPTESHVSPGDIVKIPLPLDRVINYYNRVNE